jgi:phage-related protein (TIGR01555 family)
MWMVDRLVNLVSGLGGAKDKASATMFALALMGKDQLDAAYRGDWIARKVVDIPAFDETRAWRNWQAEQDQIEAIEAEEARHSIQSKVAAARVRARLYGGSALYLGVDRGTPGEELDMRRVAKGGLRYVHVLNRYEILPGEIELDPQSPLFGEPKKYTLTTGTKASVDIHPSRVIRFVGAGLPDRNLMLDGWGDSALQAVDDAVRHAGSAAAAIAALLQEAKVDIIKMPNLMEGVATEEYRGKVIERFTLANTAKSMVNAILLDGEEEWSQKQVSFTNLPEVLNTYLQIASGAADIPATRLLGQTPGGLQSTGESDLRNYYDRISAGQNLSLRPALYRLDEAIIRSALGTRPPEVHYLWAPLWQIPEKERAEIAESKAKTTKLYAETGLLPDPALGKALLNQLVEDGTYPGLDEAIKEFGEEPGQGEDDEDEQDEARQRQLAADAAPRTLYVSRKLINGAEFLAWAKGQGFTTTLAADDLHVTIAYSRQPIDWMKVGESWSFGGKNGNLTVNPGGARLVEPLGSEGAVVLLFNSSDLAWRHMAIKEAGASWDHEGYQPHVTITYEPGDVDLSKVEPYRGKLVFGPEVFEEVKR